MFFSCKECRLRGSAYTVAHGMSDEGSNALEVAHSCTVEEDCPSSSFVSPLLFQGAREASPPPFAGFAAASTGLLSIASKEITADELMRELQSEMPPEKSEVKVEAARNRRPPSPSLQSSPSLPMSSSLPASPPSLSDDAGGGRRIFHNLVPRCGFAHRQRSYYHSKIMCCRFPGEPGTAHTSYGWAMVGSHNFSAAALGRLQGKRADMGPGGASRSSSFVDPRTVVTSNYELSVVLKTTGRGATTSHQKAPATTTTGVASLEEKCRCFDCAFPIPFSLQPQHAYGPDDKPVTSEDIPRNADGEEESYVEIRNASDAPGGNPAGAGVTSSSSLAEALEASRREHGGRNGTLNCSFICKEVSAAEASLLLAADTAVAVEASCRDIGRCSNTLRSDVNNLELDMEKAIAASFGTLGGEGRNDCNKRKRETPADGGDGRGSSVIEIHDSPVRPPRNPLPEVVEVIDDSGSDSAPF
jgi:hypothetical protein